MFFPLYSRFFLPFVFANQTVLFIALAIKATNIANLKNLFYYCTWTIG